MRALGVGIIVAGAALAAWLGYSSLPAGQHSTDQWAGIIFEALGGAIPGALIMRATSRNYSN
jgi:hypothetical protein